MKTAVNAKKRILFVAYGGGHINALLPIIQQLLQDDSYEVTVLGLTTARMTLEKNKIPFVGFKDFLKKSDKRALEVGKVLANELVESKIPFEESAAYLGLSYYDLELRLGVEEAAEMYREKKRHAFLPLTIMERIFKKIKPDLVVTTSSPRAEMAAVLVAKEKNIPTICLIDLYLLGDDAWLADSTYANKLCVQNTFMHDALVYHGRNPSDIVITGNPAFDKLKNPDLKKFGQEYRCEKKWHNKKVIVWASQPEPACHHLSKEPSPNPELPAMIAKKFIEIAPRHSDWHIVFRLHPSEKVNYTGLTKNITMSQAPDNLYILLSAADVVVTSTSTVGIESLYLNKKLVSIDMSVYTPDLSYSALDLATGVKDLDHLESVLTKVLEEPEKQIHLPPVGEAASKVITVIRELLD